MVFQKYSPTHYVRLVINGVTFHFSSKLKYDALSILLKLFIRAVESDKRVRVFRYL